MLKLLAIFDKFGVQYKPKIQHKHVYQSSLGGLVSLIIYILIFMYLGYKLYQFVTNALIPLQSVTLEYEETISMPDQGNLISFQVLNTTINPFNKTHQILKPYIRKQINNTVEEADFIYEDNQLNFSTQIYTPKNLSISVGDGTYATSIRIGLRICSPTVDGNCADQTTIDLFFKQKLIVRSTVVTQQYNSYKKEITNIARYNDFMINVNTLFFQRVILQTQLLNIDDGWLFSNSNEQRIFHDYSVQTQTNAQSDLYSRDVYMTEFTLSQIVQNKSFQFVKISSVLADVGSIYSMLMLVSVIISSVNSFWLEEDLIKQVINIYYPEFKFLQIKRKLYFGPIKQVSLKNNIVSIAQFNQFYKKARKIASGKLEFLNIIYEVSRLQFAVQNLTSRNMLERTHNQGIQLDFLFGKLESPKDPQSLTVNQTIREQQYENLLIFRDKDFSLLDQFNQHIPWNDSSATKHQPVSNEME